MRKRWSGTTIVDVPLPLQAREQRLADLILAGVIGWNFPQYWMDATNLQDRIDQLLEATKEEVLPWQT